jgi:hypothetical protein
MRTSILAATIALLGACRALLSRNVLEARKSKGMDFDVVLCDKEGGLGNCKTVKYHAEKDKKPGGQCQNAGDTRSIMHSSSELYCYFYQLADCIKTADAKPDGKVSSLDQYGNVRTSLPFTPQSWKCAWMASNTLGLNPN